MRVYCAQRQRVVSYIRRDISPVYMLYDDTCAWVKFLSGNLTNAPTPLKYIINRSLSDVCEVTPFDTQQYFRRARNAQGPLCLFTLNLIARARFVNSFYFAQRRSCRFILFAFLIPSRGLLLLSPVSFKISSRVLTVQLNTSLLPLSLTNFLYFIYGIDSRGFGH